MKKHIANGFTLLNLFFGCISIVIILDISISVHSNTNDVTNSLKELSKQLSIASFLIIGAAVVDFFDGFVARLLGIASEMGKQLDSLADVVSFGVAPSLIVFKYLQFIYLNNGETNIQALMYCIPCFLIALAGAYRLARFNISTKSTLNFEGVPIPAAAMLTISLPFILLYHNQTWINNLAQNQWFWYVYILIVSWLMVSKFPILSLKMKGLNASKDWWKILLAFLAIILSISIHWLSVPIIFLAYVFLSILFLRKEN